MTEQTPMAELLARLNSLRADVGKRHLAAWKASRASLVASIESTKAEAQAKLDAKVEAADSGDLEDHPIVKENAERTAKLRNRSRKIAAEVKAGTFSLAELAKELGVSAKVLRAKARRHTTKLNKLRNGATGWSFASKHRVEVTNILTKK